MIKARRMKWVGYTARIGEKYIQSFIGEPEGSRPYEDVHVHRRLLLERKFKK
jgi:hypothetical protein